MASFKISNLLKATGQFMVQMVQLQKAETALGILPQDTKFAIVIEGIQKAKGESFMETNSVTMAGPTIGSGGIGFGFGQKVVRDATGMTGRFQGYLSLTDTDIRIYSVMDINQVASGTEQTNSQPQLIFQDAIANTSVEVMEGNFVITNATSQIKLLQAMLINGLQGQFASSATGSYGGFQPTFAYLQGHGVQGMPEFKGATTAWIVIIAILVVFGAIAFMAAGSK